jgi:hypothetical protein
LALSISQIAAISYPAVLAEMRSPENNWAENAALRELESQGFIKSVSLGPTIEVPVDYRANPDAAIMASDQDAAALLKTEVLTSASFTPAQLNVPVTWTKGDDAKNPTQTQKVELVRSLLENAITSHDDLIEQAVFTDSTAGGTELEGTATMIPTSGQGTVGGIDASVETWWRNQADTYTDGSDIEAGMTAVYDTAAKGSGAQRQPKCIISGSVPHALYESQLQSLKRYGNDMDAKAGFGSIMFKNAKYIYSQYGGTSLFFLNPQNFNLVVSKEYFRDKGETFDVPGQNAFYFLVYSALQFVTSAKSRLAVLSQS